MFQMILNVVIDIKNVGVCNFVFAKYFALNSAQ